MRARMFSLPEMVVGNLFLSGACDRLGRMERPKRPPMRYENLLVVVIINW